MGGYIQLKNKFHNKLFIMTDRREFIRLITLAGMAAGMGLDPLKLMADDAMVKLSILHTNDTHSQIEPFALTDGKFPGMGGFSRRAAIIKKIRKQESNVLLFDAGDVFTGSPYFNVFKGELEYRLMSEMGYDGGTIGNHEFDNGLEELSRQTIHARFPLISSNYDFSGTPMEGKTLSYNIYNVKGITIGVYGLGPKLEGLVDKKLFGSAKWNNPIATASEIEEKLKKNCCDFIICLSHLGFGEKDYDFNDQVLARNTRHTNLIIGGHSHTFLDNAIREKNRIKKQVDIVQVGWAGLKLGKYDVFFNHKKELVACHSDTIKIFKNQV